MNPQSAGTDYSFAFLPSDSYTIAHKQWTPQTTDSSSRPSGIDNIIEEIKNEHDHLLQTNKTLTDTLQQFLQENEKLRRMLRLKESYLQAAQRRIEELNGTSSNIAGQMQIWQSRLATCEQYISKFQQSFEKIIQPTQGSNAALQANNQPCVPYARQSTQSTNLSVDTPQGQQSSRDKQQSSAKKTPRPSRQRWGVDSLEAFDLLRIIWLLYHNWAFWYDGGWWI